MRSSRNRTHIFTGLILFGLISLLIVMGIPSSTALQPSLAALPPAQPTCTPPPSGMVSWWPGDGNAFDIQDANSGTTSGTVTFVPGKVGQAFNFDGGGSVDIADNANLRPETLTIDAWVKPDFNGRPRFVFDADIIFQKFSNPNGYVLLLTQDPNNAFDGSPGGNPTPNGTIALDLNVNGTLRAVFSSTPVPDDGEYHHVAATYDGTDIKLYLDGTPVGALSAPGTPTHTTDPAGIGALPGRTSDVAIDEVEFFGRALSANEILDIYEADSAGKCRTCTPPPSQMVSWWPGDGHTFDIQDGNDGTLQNGATFAPGKVAEAFSFDGTNQVVEVPDAPNLNFAATSPITVDLWAFRTGLANPVHLVGKRAGCAFDFLSTINYQMALDSNGLEFGAGPGNRVTTGIDLPLNTWTHLAGTFDGTTFRLYMNGVLIGTGSGVLGSAGTAPLKIGGSGDCATFPGLLDEVEIFDRALSQSEIQLIVNAGNTGKCKPPADLAITKTHSGDFTQGDVGKTYTITVTNTGATPTSDTVNVADTVPAGLMATAISGTGWSCAQPSGPCTRGDALAPRASYPPVTLTVDVANNAPTSVTNTATVSGGGEVNTGNDTANDPTTINAGPDVTITKSHSGNFSQGQTGAQYTITVTNSGGTATSGTVTVTDTVPSGLTATAISGAGWSCTQPSGPCTRSDALAASASYPIITLTVNVASNAPASVTNTATVSGGNETNAGNDTANDLTTINPVTGPDLTLTKSHNGNFSQGQTGAQYTVTVTNSGGTATSGTVSVSDTVPSGLTATAISGTGWSCTQPAGPCTRSTALNPSASYPVLTLTVKVASNAPASVTNTATVSGGGETNTGNNTANDLTTINPSSQTKADLDISKSDASDPVLLGGNITYKIEVENDGPGKATGVTVTDTLPGNVNFVSASSGCSYNAGTVTCTKASLANHDDVQWTIIVHPNVAGNFTNTASVTANQPDPKLSNNTDHADTKVVIGVASVSLNPSTVKGGNNVTGTVTLSAPAPSNTVVTLSSSNESVAKPTVSSIAINSGQMSKTFTVKTFSVSSTKTAKIKASANGASKEATLTVTH